MFVVGNSHGFLADMLLRPENLELRLATFSGVNWMLCCFLSKPTLDRFSLFTCEEFHPRFAEATTFPGRFPKHDQLPSHGTFDLNQILADRLRQASLRLVFLSLDWWRCGCIVNAVPVNVGFQLGTRENQFLADPLLDEYTFLPDIVAHYGQVSLYCLVFFLATNQHLSHQQIKYLSGSVGGQNFTRGSPIVYTTYNIGPLMKQWRWVSMSALSFNNTGRFFCFARSLHTDWTSIFTEKRSSNWSDWFPWRGCVGDHELRLLQQAWASSERSSSHGQSHYRCRPSQKRKGKLARASKQIPW